MRLFSVVFLLFVLLPSLSFADCSNRVNSIQSVGDMKAAFRCLNDKIEELEQKLSESGKGGVVRVNQIPNLPTPTISQTMTENEFKYDLLRCSNKGGKAECELRFTRLGADTQRNFGIDGETEMYDENGNEYNPTYVQIANKSSNGDTYHRFISNVPTKVILRFNGVSPQITRIAVLNIRQVDNSRTILVSFRDIALQR